MRITKFLSIFALASAAVVQADLADYINDVPKCGLQCIVQVLSTSVCDLSNQTCICENKDVAARTQTCLTQNCTVIEAFQVANISNLSCGRDKPDKSQSMIYTSILGAVAIICVILRLIARWELEGEYKADDYFMAIAGACLVPFCVLGVLAATHAFGKNIWDIPTKNLVQGLKFFFWDEILYISILGLCKISILMFYLRIFPSQTFKYTCVTLLGITALITVLFQALTLFQCWPLSYNWEGWKGEMHGVCLNINKQTYASSSLNIILDFAILILPLPWLFKLQIGLRRKIHVIVMFSMGIFIFIVSVIRINFVNEFRASVNPTWDYTEPIFWSAIETYVAVIVPSLPAIRSWLSRHYPKAFGIDTQAQTSAYERSRIQATNSKSFKMISVTTSSNTKQSNSDIEDGQYFANSNLDNLDLGDQMKGTVHTGIVAGGRVGTPNSDEYLVPEKAPQSYQ